MASVWPATDKLRVDVRIHICDRCLLTHSLCTVYTQTINMVDTNGVLQVALRKNGIFYVFVQFDVL